MANNEFTKHLVVDLKTGFVYGLKLDGEGNCKGVQSYNLVVETTDGRVLSKFGPSVGSAGALTPVVPKDVVPYDKTTFAFELTQEGKKGETFTIVWPSKIDAEAGVLPQVARKESPDDLIKSGFAPAPKAMKGSKGSAVTSDEDLKNALKNIDRMIGLDKAKHDIKQNIAVARFNQMKVDMGLATKPISRHMVFTGNPGTGKTTFAREVAQVYHALGFIDKPTVHEVTREDLVAGYVGQTALKTKEQIDKAKGGILFIDEAYALSRGTGGPGDDGKDFGREAIDTLVAAMENMRDDLIVIVAGYSDPMKKFIDANPGLKSRFMTYIGFEDYTVPQLGEILDVMLKDRGYTMAPAAREQAMQLLEADKKAAGPKEFGNGRTVRNLVEKAEKELAMRLESENKLSKGHGLSDDEMKHELTTLTLQDIRKISLDGLGAKKVEASPIGFADGESFKPANDITPPAKAAPAAKRSAGAHFPHM